MTAAVGTSTRWQVAIAAINGLLTTFKDRAYFGLSLFPDTDGANCTQGSIPIPLAPMNAAPIQSLLNAALQMNNANFPKGPCVTNIDTGLKQAASDPGLKEANRRGFVLLITDGAQSGCNAGGGDTGSIATINQLHQQGIDTFVVGFGSGVDTATLNALADKGGQPTSDPTTRFYKAEDRAQLEAALEHIRIRAMGCTYQLQAEPPDPSKLFVFFNGANQVLRDPAHTRGWDYEATAKRVTFYGADCEAIKANQVTKLDIVYGCPTIEVQ